MTLTIGIGVMVYNYNGEVYLSDEGRMLAEMGDKILYWKCSYWLL